MADVELVIRIPNEIYQDVIKNRFIYDEDSEVISHAIIDGALLPKGHGRLIDSDAYLKKVCTYKETGCGSCRFQTVCPVDELTVIEADKG